MNRIEQLINNPTEVDLIDLDLLNMEIEKYPYFYSLHALKLIALKKGNHPEFEKQLHLISTINNNKGLYYLLNSEEQSVKLNRNHFIKELIELNEAEKTEENKTDLIEDVNGNLIDLENSSIENNIISDENTLAIESIQITELDDTQNDLAEESIENIILTNEILIEQEDNIDDLPKDKSILINTTHLTDINPELTENIIKQDEELIEKSIENSIQVTNDLTQNEEIISKAIEETKDVLISTNILEEIEQVDLVNRSIINIDSAVDFKSKPITTRAKFQVLNPKDKIVRNSEQFNTDLPSEINTIVTNEITIEENLPEETKEIQTIEEVIDQNLNVNQEVIKAEIPKTESNFNAFTFNDWLKLSSSNTMEVQQEKEQKFQIIEEFLEKNPKIKPLSKQEIPESKSETKNTTKTDFSDLMTETLAQIYIEQKQYDKAIKAYKILILKYPEKNSLFANQIKEIQNLKNSK